MMRSYYRPSITGIPEMGLCAQQLYATPVIGPQDIQAAIIYDHFTPLVLPQLEEFGFCERGEAKDFIRDGNIEIGGRLPDQHQWRPARRGLHPRHERHRRGGAAGTGQCGEPARRVSPTCSSRPAPPCRPARWCYRNHEPTSHKSSDHKPGDHRTREFKPNDREPATMSTDGTGRKQYRAFAVCVPGLEGTVAAELRALGVRRTNPARGGVEFNASPRQLYAANVWLRTATRITVRVAAFPGADLERP